MRKRTTTAAGHPISAAGKSVDAGEIGGSNGIASRVARSGSKHDARGELGLTDVRETELMAGVRRGDTRAFERIVQRYWPRTLRYAEQLTQDRDGALDVTQEAFARLWERRADWIHSGSVTVWFYRTVRNLIVSDQRRRRVRSRWAGRVLNEAHPPPRTPLQEVEAQELRNAITRAIDELPPRRREAFTLFHVQGFAYREIAEIMDVRQQTVANHLQAAVVDLRASLAPFLPAIGKGDDITHST